MNIDIVRLVLIDVKVFQTETTLSSNGINEDQLFNFGKSVETIFYQCENYGNIDSISEKIQVFIGEKEYRTNESLSEIILLYIKKKGISPNEILIITNNTDNDIWIAKEFGCNTILVSNVLYSEFQDILLTNSVFQVKTLFELTDGDGLKKLLKINRPEEIEDFILGKYENITSKLKVENEVYIFGASTMGQQILQYCRKRGIVVKGFLDNDPRKQNTYIEGITIISPDILHDKDSTIIVAIGQGIISVCNDLMNKGFEYIFHFHAFTFCTNILDRSNKEENFHKDLVLNKFKYLSLYMSLADNKSRKVLNGLINYRLDLDISNLIIDRAEDQYFDKEIISLGKDEVFVDGGGFDGSTTSTFISKVKGEYTHIYYFEPDLDHFKWSQVKLGNLWNISFFNIGIYHDHKSLVFGGTGGMNGAINESGTTRIEVDSLDNIIKDKITYIKYDIEGAEYDGLLGARDHILNDNPKLAICAYHKSNDLWNLTELISRLNNCYKFYLRHYTSGPYETVLYATI